MKTLKILLLVVALTVSTSFASAQEEYSREYVLPKYTIAVQPLYLFNGGLRADFEKQLDSPGKWLQFHVSGFILPEKEIDYQNYRTHYYYYDNSWGTFNSNFNDILGLYGFGLGSAYKYLFKHSSFYFSAGLNYNFYNVTYANYGLESFVEDGMTFYEYRYSPAVQNFHKFRPNANIGIQSSLSNLVFYDFYIGLGYAYSLYDKSKKAFDSTIFGYGYRGLTISGGFRIGVTFGK